MEQYNIIIIGDSGVGKSALLQRYINNSFDNKFPSTIGIDFYTKNIKINNDGVKLIFWDTSGQEKYADITTSYYKKAQVVIYCHSCNNEESYNNIEQIWKDKIQKWHPNPDNLVEVYVSTKSDLNKSYQEDIHISNHFVTSSKKGEGIDEVFNYVINELTKKRIVPYKMNNRSQCYELRGNSCC